MASSQANQILQQYPHRTPLDRDQIRALCNALTSLNTILGDDNAIKTSVYCAILRLLKAHVTPIPTHASVTFAQVQAARLQLLAEKLVSERKHFPHQLTAAISQGLVSGFDPTTRLQIPHDRQKLQLQQQQLADRQQLLEEHRLLTERQADFSRTRETCINVMRACERQQSGPDPDLFIAWEQRHFKSQSPATSTQLLYARLDEDTLTGELQRYVQHRTATVVSHIDHTFQNHRNGTNPLSPRDAALLETRVRHSKLLSLQTKMRQSIWEVHQPTEREGRRGSRGRTRTLKQLQREFEKVDRARLRQVEAEERDVRRKRQAWMNSMVDHLNKFRSYHRDVVRRGMRAVTKAVMKHHEEVSRNANRAEREAERARIQKLKDDDEEGYLQLVRQTKNTRLLELLDQTDKYLKELGAVVKEERAKSGVVEYENGRQKPGARVNYYEIAHAIKEDVLVQSSLLVGGKLKEYQLQGIQWMVSLYNNRLNGILADEMGLGKTIQTLGLIAHLMETKDNPGPYLIIVPLSTISNWELEFARWAPAMRVIVFKGDAKARKKLYEEVIEKNSFNVCLVSYEYVVRGKNLLKRVEWQHLVIDEGHRIKNHESRLSSVLHTHYRSRNRLLLTGTPLQNSLTELWALLNFLLPNVFKSAESFESWFAAPFAQMGVGNVATSDQQGQLSEEESLLIIRRLHQVLRPFLLRRLKSDVLRMGEQLPDKQEHVVLVEMSAWQRAMYLKIVKSESLLFTDRHGRQRYDKLPNPAVQLRKCVNHPYLFYADHASRIVDSPQLWRASGKFDMLDSIVMKLLRTGHRILVFNQMTKVVDLQERLLRYRNIPFYRLDGTTGTEERKQMVNDFNDENTEIDVFLLTTRAGGLGVNLQTADSVIIFDSDWNPSMDQQAQDRAHRIGQRREVLVIRMLTAKSIEEDVMQRASYKRGLEKKIIRAGMFDEQSKDSERQAMLRELLRVEGPCSEDDHPEDGLPTDEEVNRILARSENEYDIFTQIDQERSEEIVPRPRLMVDKEIPEWASKVPKALLLKAKVSGAGSWARADVILDMPKKRRAATTNVSYGVDQLSERQYIKLMERSEAGEELSFDAVRAATRRRKRRKKGESRGGTDDNGTNDESSLRVSDTVPESIGGKGPRKSVPRIASKSLHTDVKSYDDDVTEGGDHSAAPSGGEDMLIEDDDDDDGDDDAGEGDENNDADSDRDVVVTPHSERESDSDFSDGSESASEPIPSPVRGRKRGRPAKCKSEPKRPRYGTASRDSSEVRARSDVGKISRSPSIARGTNQSESSDESPSPIRRTASRKRPKITPTNLRSAPVSINARKKLSSDLPLNPPVAKKTRVSPEIRAPRGPQPEIDTSILQRRGLAGSSSEAKNGALSNSSTSISKLVGSSKNGKKSSKKTLTNPGLLNASSGFKHNESLPSSGGASVHHRAYGNSKSPISKSSVPPVPRLATRKLSLSTQRSPPTSGISKASSQRLPALKKTTPLPTFSKIPASAPVKLSSAPTENDINKPPKPYNPISKSSTNTLVRKVFSTSLIAPVGGSSTKPALRSTSATTHRSPTVRQSPSRGFPKRSVPFHTELKPAIMGSEIQRSKQIDENAKVEDDAEDGEIREEGEVSEDGEVAEDGKAKRVVNPLRKYSRGVSMKSRGSETSPEAGFFHGRGKVSHLQPAGMRSGVTSAPPPISSLSKGPSISRPGSGPTVRSAGPPSIGRSCAMPVRPSMASANIPAMRPPPGPPTSAPIIAMPRVPTAGGMRPPLGITAPVGMMNHGMVTPPIVPMAQGMGQHYLYGMRGGPGYAGGVGMYGPPGRMTSGMHRGMHNSYRPLFNPRPSPITTPQNGGNNSVRQSIRSSIRNGATTSASIQTADNKSTAMVRETKKLAAGRAEKSQADMAKSVNVKDVEDGEEGEIEEEGEIVEEP